MLLERQCTGKLSKEYSVMKNVSTHSVINTADGELELKLELDDVGVFPSKNHVDNCNISHAEKMTQTEVDLLSRGGRIGRQQTPNGTSPCNHPSLTCQVRWLDLGRFICCLAQSRKTLSRGKSDSCRHALYMSVAYDDMKS